MYSKHQNKSHNLLGIFKGFFGFCSPSLNTFERCAAKGTCRNSLPTYSCGVTALGSADADALEASSQ